MRTGDVPSLADLDRLYFQGSPVELAKAVAALPRVYALSMSELYEQVISDVRDGKAGTIHPELYRAYSENLRKAVSGYANDDLKTQFEANLSRFAAYKAWHATRQLERQLADSDGVERSPEAFDRMARAVLNTFNRYQAAEYNTAVARARTAHQWQQFSQGDNMFLFPNLRWLPSRSANPREEHKPFYNLVLPKNHTFWTHNQPGSLWNCKCDWEETDDPTDTRDLTPKELADYSTAQGAIHARGLEGNPVQTGQIFTDQCTYINNSGQNRRERDKTEEWCEEVAHKLFKYSARQSPLLSKTCQCEIDGMQQDIHFADWGISETTHAMHGKKRMYWLKNEVLNNPEGYFKKASYVGDAEVDLSHNTNRNTLRLKRKFRKYYYCQTTLADGQTAYLNIVLHDDGKYYLYTISKEIHEY